jgi:hypothetical protein
MRRLIALVVLWVGLLGAGSPVLTCAAGAAAGDCCSPDAPSGCIVSYEQLDAAATICCAAAGPSHVVSIEPGRELQIQPDSGSTDPVVIVAAFAPFTHPKQQLRFIAPLASSARTDAALTYLHTGRLRL